MTPRFAPAHAALKTFRTTFDRVRAARRPPADEWDAAIQRPGAGTAPGGNGARPTPRHADGS